MKKVMLLFLLLIPFAGADLNAQTYYETSWMSGGIRYDALLIFYDDNDILVRTKYTSGSYKVAEYTATAQTVTLDDGSLCYYIDGSDASIVYGEGGYTADNFIFYADGNGWGTPYAIDDKGLEAANVQEHMVEVMFWREIDPEVTFTQKYVYNYFQKDEYLYNVLLGYHQDNLQNHSGIHNGAGADGEWQVFMSKGTGYGLQSWFTRKEWDKDKIRGYWDDDKHITDVSYGNGLWLVTMSKNSGFGTQSWSHGINWPDEWIEKKWNDGKAITEIAYGDGKWSVVMSSKTGYTDQKYIVSEKWPKAWLDENWKTTNYQFTNITYGAGHWVIVLSRHPSYNPGQRIRAGKEFPEDDIRESQAEGYDVTTMAYGDEWVVILTKNQGLTQVYDESPSFPKPFVGEKWDLGYSISEAVYSYREENSVVVLNFTGTASMNGSSNNTIAHTPSTTTNTPTNNGTTTTTTVLTEVPEMHVVVVANTKVPDIGTSCAVDRNNVVDEFTDIAKGLGIEMHKYIVDGENLSKSKVNSTLSRLNPGPNDIVIFAYTGHGFRWSNQTSRYPMMALFYSRFDSPSNSNSMNLEDVYNKIVAKGARLNIVMGDCCNNDIGVTSREGTGSLASRSFSRGSTQRLRKLFFDSKGSVLIAAAKPGETACGSRISGGYFLNAFFSGIDREISLTTNSTPSWDSILDRSIKSATYKTQNLTGCSAQHGVFKNSVVR